jgi:uncharacterized protein
MTGQLAPTAPGDRVPHLDVLRGLAILGILMVNAPSFAMPFTVTGVPDTSPLPFEQGDFAVWWTMRTVFEQKFVNLFSLLFGVSIYLVGGEWGEAKRAGVLRRRLFWLFVVGLVHGAVIWFGDILLHYALVGAIMSQFRSWTPRRLTIAGMILFAISSLMIVGGGLLAGTIPPEAQAQAFAPYSAEAVRGYIAGFGGDDLADVQRENLSAWAMLQSSSLIAYGPRTLGMMMFGLALYKTGVLQGGASTRLYLLLTGLAAATLVLVGWSALNQYRAGFPLAGAQGADTAANTLLSPLITLGYVALIALLLRGGAGRAIGAVLAPAGRMAFTNYLTQSLIMTAIFFGGGRGLGLYGELDWMQWMGIVAAVWAVQLVWSRLWLQRFSMGPAEWVWRKLSYGGAVPLRRPAISTTAQA